MAPSGNRGIFLVALVMVVIAVSSLQAQAEEKVQEVANRHSRSACKIKLECEIAGGSCVTNASECNGRLAPGGCKGKSCQCCIPATGCPKGTFWFPPSNQCFKFLGDSRRNWNDGKAACHSDGLVLARPYFPVETRAYLVTRYGPDVEVWINGRGNGTFVVWQNNGEQITSANPLWWPGMPGTRVTTSYCLLLRSREPFWKDHLENPYYMTICTRGLFTLCEGEME